MKQVTYKPVNGAGETANIIGIEFEPGKPVSVSDDQADELLRNRNFVDASTGKNPRFVCVGCGKDAIEDTAFDPVRARTANTPFRSLINKDGYRRCASCPENTPKPEGSFVSKIGVKDAKVSEEQAAE